MTRLLAFLLIFVISACATSIDTRSDANPDIDFTGYRTFAWIGDTPFVDSMESDRPRNPLVLQRITRAIRDELTAKGYAFTADQGAADFVVAYTVGARNQIDVDTRTSSTNVPYYRYYGRRGAYRGWGYGAYYGTETVTTAYTQGVIAIDAFDAESEAPAWHGYSTRRIEERDRKDPEPIVVEVVQATLADFPIRSN